MNLQQLKYIMAIDRFRNFAKAADACNISQPTLSAMLMKLEEELDVRIFERSNKMVTLTAVGEKILRQAQTVVMETDRITEIVREEKGALSDAFSLSVGPTIAPYLLPKFIKHYQESYPSVALSISEMKANFMLDALLRGELDAGIAIADNVRPGILEIPLYSERFYVYLAESCWRKLPVFKPENLEHENMWIMKEAIDDFKSGKLDEIYLIYTKIQNALTSEPVMERLLPLDREHLQPAPKGLGDPRGEVELVPDAWTVFEQTAPIYMHGMIFGAMTESFCAEQSARMTAMDSATKSANDMIRDLQLEYNRTRQGSITQEITEIIGGASAVKSQE